MPELDSVFIDECGYTGEDLFNTEQPVFTLATLCLPEEKCIELKNMFFSNINATELKHSNLARRPKQQEMVLNFLRHIAKQLNYVKFSIVHKRYVLISKIIDLIIEPMAYEDGFDLYKDGLNIALSNVLYFSAQKLAGEEFFENMVRNFQVMIREKTLNSYKSFFRMFFKNNFHKNLDELIIHLRMSHIRYGPNVLYSIPKDSLQIAFAEAFSLVCKWSESITGNFIIIHDESSNMAKNKKLWDKALHPDVLPKIVGYDRRKMCFPIRVEKTEFKNSKDFAGLQLVDIMAGAMARCVKWIILGRNNDDNYAKKLSCILPQFAARTIWPSTDVTPRELRTTGPIFDDAIRHFIDFMSEEV